MKLSIEIEATALAAGPGAKLPTYWIAINATPRYNQNFQNQEKT